MNGREIFSLIVGMSTIGGFIFGFVSLFKNKSKKVEQTIKDNKIDNGSTVIQVSGNYSGARDK